MFCNKCGNQVNTGAAFCGKCGNTVETTSVAKPNPTQTPPATEPVQAQTTPKGGKKFAYIGGTAALIVIAVVIGIFVFGDDEKNVINGYEPEITEIANFGSESEAIYDLLGLTREELRFARKGGV